MNFDAKPTHIDLFSGIGSFSIAFESAGFRTVRFSEICPTKSRVLREFWPNIPNSGDIANLPDEYADVVTAGVPCQAASGCGLQLGVNDDGWMWWRAIDAVCRIGPQFAVFENVPNLLRVNGGAAFNGILSRLAAGGFDAWWTCISASIIGAPIKRERLFIVAFSVQQRRTRVLRREPRVIEIPPTHWPANALDSRCAVVQAIEESLGQPSLFSSYDGPATESALAAYGDSVCPQVAQIFAKAIYKELI